MVLESPQRGPMLCVGFIATSLPPQCGDVPITNWDWTAVEGEESRAGTTWGDYRVVGTYDGRAFTVIEASPWIERDPEQAEDPIDTPCPEPAGGWRAADPTKISEGHFAAAAAFADSQPESAGVWVDYVVEPDPDAAADPERQILNAAFTGNLERHEAALRERWGGPLCVTQHDYTLAELERIQEDLTSRGAEALGLELLSVGVFVPENAVELVALVVDGEAREALDVRYGEGAVRASGALRPVP
jgi:hypothetical protein